VAFVKREKFAHIVDGNVWALFVWQMREGVSVADAGVDGHGERTTAQRHRYFQRGIIANHGEFFCSNAETTCRTAQRFERRLADNVDACAGEILDHR
jgi:hypothetical protein